MAVSTKIVHRRDTAANWTSTNPTLANGEIGFETDTLKFKVGNGSTAWTSLKYSQDASLLNGTASITALSTTGDINTAGKLNVTASAGDEGGEIFLAKPVTNTSINTGVTIDVYKNTLRFFEQGGDARGYYIDITAGGAGVGTNLVGGGSAFNGGTITNALVVSNTSGVNTSGTYTSTIATGTAPFTVSSTTQVANLNVATSGSVNATVTGTNSANLVYGSMGDNDQFRIQIGATATNAGFVEIATADDGTEPIHVRQYTGVFTTLARTATLLDGSGNTTFPGTVSGTRFISNVATGTAPFTVTSTTQVANLNVATSGTTSNVLGGAAGRILYQSGVNTTAFLTAPATNNSILAYNTATGAPEWDTPPLAMATLTGYTSTVTAAGATSLTNASSFYQQFTGTTTQTVILPNTATLITGWTFHIVNNSTGNVTANTFANAATLMVIPANTTAMVTCINTASNTATGWEIGLTDFGTYTGTGSVVMNTSPTISTPSITTNLTTSSASFDLINANATTVNFAGAANTFTVGATTGTLSLRNPTITTSVTSGTLALFNTGLTGTLNIGGAAGTINIGSSTTTKTVNIATATTVGNSSTVRIGTNEGSGTTSDIYLQGQIYAGKTVATTGTATGTATSVFGPSATATGTSGNAVGGNLTILSGNASIVDEVNVSGTATSGNLILDVGTVTTQGGGTGAGNVQIGTTRAASISLGRTGVSVTTPGAITATQTITGGNLTTGGSLTRTALSGGGTTGASINDTGAFIRTTSSERYKQDIQDANFVYEDVLALSPKTFRLKEEVESNPNSKIYGGLIAEDVDQIESLKVFVNYKTEDGLVVPDGIAYGEMVAALVSALKHQNSIIENLTSRVEFLENN
jgi:hypothetical protein